MRVFITGAVGFVGAWLSRELTACGHQVVPAPGPETMDICDQGALVRWLDHPDGPPDAVVHLAGMAFAPDARSDPAEGFRVNVGGTVALFESLRTLGSRPPVLVSGSADVYGQPGRPGPIDEDSPLNPRHPYALSKLGQEAVAFEEGVRYGFPVVVARSFNHTGPGQRPVFVVPAMAQRVLAVRAGQASSIPAGNVDVRRDLTDVRDVVRAYRLLLERALSGGSSTPLAVNVASGVTFSIRSIVEMLCRLAEVQAPIRVDQALVRPNDPPELCGDRSLVGRMTGWQPQIPIETTLRDMLIAYGLESGPAA